MTISSPAPNPSPEIPDTLAYLIGRWRIERTIEDHRDASTARFVGVASVDPTPAGASYREAGTLTRGGHSGPARRSLEFVRGPEGRVRVDFPDGHRFLDLDLHAGACAETHPCRADRYVMGFEVLDGDHLHETWRVRGPEKDYSAETTWSRLR